MTRGGGTVGARLSPRTGAGSNVVGATGCGRGTNGKIAGSVTLTELLSANSANAVGGVGVRDVVV